nr:B3 domain-containing transcription repressor VAL1-like isoform X1 [Tanacetum cinerariifolium]
MASDNPDELVASCQWWGRNYHSDSPNGFLPFSGPWHPSSISNRVNGGASVDKGNLTQLNEAIEKHQSSPLTPSIGLQIKQDENRFSSSKDTGKIFSSASSLFATPDNGLKALYEAIPQPSINYNLGNAIATTKSPVLPNTNGVLPNPNGAVDGKDSEKAPSFKQGQRSRLTFTKPSKSGVSIRSQANKGTVSDNRVARPPAEGKGRSQLLPRYWPKMTDQELLQISG